jgi:TonB family protein
MRDRVADVLAQRAALDRGAGVGVVFSVLLHGALVGAAVYTALHAPPRQNVNTLNIQFAKMPAMSKPTEPVKKATPATPKIDEPKPVIAEPKPEPPKTEPKKPEKNTVPLSPFGKSTKKGSETPPPAPVPPSTANQQPSTTPEVPVGGAGITALEGGDFPYTLYLEGMQRKIGTKWFRPGVNPGTTTIIYFRIQRDGTISDADYVTKSGNPTFDRAALSAVRSASPLNPLPFAYSGTYLGVHLTFR